MYCSSDPEELEAVPNTVDGSLTLTQATEFDMDSEIKYTCPTGQFFDSGGTNHYEFISLKCQDDKTWDGSTSLPDCLCKLLTEGDFFSNLSKALDFRDWLH